MNNASTFPAGRTDWLGRLERVRNVVRQEVIARHLDRHLSRHVPGADDDGDDAGEAAPGVDVLDVGAGQGTQSVRLARAGHRVLAVEPDGRMREAFARNLADQDDLVRSRVQLVAGGVEDLPVVAAGRRFDVVLLLGVLMYLPSTEPVLAALARRTRAGGMVALAVRTTTSALWRPAARQDWAAAEAAFAEHDRARTEGRDVAYVNEIGSPARAVDLDDLVLRAARHDLELEEWYGVRVAVDPQELDPPPPSDPQVLANLLDVEERLGAVDPFRHLGQLVLVIFRAGRVSAPPSA